MPRERGILFSAPMVLRLLDGSKTQTRRILKPQPHAFDDFTKPGAWWPKGEHSYNLDSPTLEMKRTLAALCPHGAPGDLLYAKETFVYRHKHDRVYYRADHPVHDPYAHNGWKPSIFMPKKYARIWREITGVKVERAQDISEEDARAEGADPWALPTDIMMRTSGAVAYRTAFRWLWSSINGEESWKANPWVWVISFKPAERKAVAHG